MYISVMVPFEGMEYSAVSDVVLSSSSPFSLELNDTTDLVSRYCPRVVLNGQRVSPTFFFFCTSPLWFHECGTRQKAADGHKIFIFQKDIQLNVTTFHFKNQLDSGKSCSRRRE